MDIKQAWHKRQWSWVNWYGFSCSLQIARLIIGIADIDFSTSPRLVNMDFITLATIKQDQKWDQIIYTTKIKVEINLHGSARTLSSSSLIVTTKSLICIAIAVWYWTPGISGGFWAVALTPKTVSTATELSWTLSASRTLSKLVTYLCSVSDCLVRYSASSRLSAAKK